MLSPLKGPFYDFFHVPLLSVYKCKLRELNNSLPRNWVFVFEIV